MLYELCAALSGSSSDWSSLTDGFKWSLLTRTSVPGYLWKKGSGSRSQTVSTSAQQGVTGISHDRGTHSCHQGTLARHDGG